MTSVDIKKGDNLFSDCKDVFLDLQKHKNENNKEVKKMMREMQQLMDSNYVEQSSMSLMLDQSSFGAIRRDTDASRKDESKLFARNFSSNINAPAGDATDNNASNANNNLFEDESDDYENPNVRLSNATPKKVPNFEVDRIRYQLVENMRHKHVLPETVVDNTQSESMVQVLEADFKPTVHLKESRTSGKETPVVEFYEI